MKLSASRAGGKNLSAVPVHIGELESLTFPGIQTPAPSLLAGKVVEDCFAHFHTMPVWYMEKRVGLNAFERWTLCSRTKEEGRTKHALENDLKDDSNFQKTSRGSWKRHWRRAQYLNDWTDLQLLSVERLSACFHRSMRDCEGSWGAKTS